MILRIRGECPRTVFYPGVLGADYTVLRWKGKLEGREGSFPANFVEIV